MYYHDSSNTLVTITFLSSQAELSVKRLVKCDTIHHKHQGESGHFLILYLKESSLRYIVLFLFLTEQTTQAKALGKDEQCHRIHLTGNHTESRTAEIPVCSVFNHLPGHNDRQPAHLIHHLQQPSPEFTHVLLPLLSLHY